MATQKQIAAQLDITDRHLRRLYKDGVLTPGGDAEKNRVEYIRYLRDMKTTEDLELEKERALLAREQRRKLELQNEEAEGRLVNAEEVKKEWTKYVAACRAKLLSLPTKLAPMLIGKTDPKEARDLVKKGVYEALNELAAGQLDQ